MPPGLNPSSFAQNPCPLSTQTSGIQRTGVFPTTLASEWQAFDRFSRDQFFLSIEAVDPKYSSADTLAFAHTLGALSVEEVME